MTDMEAKVIRMAVKGIRRYVDRLETETTIPFRILNHLDRLADEIEAHIAAILEKIKG